MKYNVNNLLEKGRRSIKSFDGMMLTPKFFLLFSLAFVFIFSLFVMVFFFAFVEGEEQVMVPNVIGKSLVDALVEMQVKELYPKLVLQYSDNPFDKGRVLNQIPLGGVITKAGKRITLTVSQGPILATVEDYIGLNFTDVQNHLQTLFPDATTALLMIDDPLYAYSDQPEGTIIEQNPKPETPIVDRMSLKFVISRGPEYINVKVPNFVGLSIDDIYSQMAISPVSIDFSTRTVQSSDTIGEIVSQLPEGDTVINRNTRIGVVMAVPNAKVDGRVYGVATTDLPEYPYPLTITVNIIHEKNEITKLTSFRHSGGFFSFPYALPMGTIISFSIGETQIFQTRVE
ncbi:MAG: PASTA domain-containing protein [Treponemataceae bacterium]